MAEDTKRVMRRHVDKERVIATEAWRQSRMKTEDGRLGSGQRSQEVSLFSWY